jgi:hypothetical protein
MFLLIAYLYQYLCAYGLCYSSATCPTTLLLYYYLFLCIQIDLQLDPLPAPPWHLSATRPVEPLPWRWHTPSPPYVPKISCIFPSTIGIFLSGCICLSRWFCCMILKLGGITWNEWNRRTSKLVFPSHLFDFTLQDVYAPSSVTPKWQHKPSTTTHDRKRLLALLGILSASVTQVHPFDLCSEVQHRRSLRCYRSAVGDLKTTNLNTHDLTVLQRQLRSSGRLFQDLTQHSPHVFTCIVDSGCSYSATNSFTDVDPGTIRKLKTPITLGGIAGSLAIEYVGRANWETLDDQGQVVNFSEDVLIHTDLPDRLLSPQSFLSRQGKASSNASHFRV